MMKQDGIVQGNGLIAGNALVTGAAGFIGSHIVDRLLERGWYVWGLDNFDAFYARRTKEANLEEALPHPNFRLAEGDIRDDGFLAEVFRQGQFDLVIHMAARAGVRPSIEAPDEYYDTNVMGTLRLLETMRRFGVRPMVFASSSSVYGERLDPEPFREADEVDRPISPYAATKRACELLCHTYWYLHGLRCYALRFFTVYGPRQRPDLAIHKFARLALAGRPIPIYGDGSAERDFTYIDDVLKAVEASMDRAMGTVQAPAFEILNIGAHRTVTVKALVELLADAMEVSPEIEHLPPQAGDVPRTWADISRAREVLGWEPKVPIEEGIRRFVAWLWARQEAGAQPRPSL